MQGEMNRLFTGFSAAAARDFPPINIWLGDNSVVVTAELPGVTRDDVSISLQDEVLTVEGARQPAGAAGRQMASPRAWLRHLRADHSTTVPGRP